MKRIIKNALVGLAIISLIFSMAACSREDSAETEAMDALSSYSSSDTLAEEPAPAADPMEAPAADGEAKEETSWISDEKASEELSGESSSGDMDDIINTTEDRENVVPQAGQLTAGEWQDNENYDFFLDLLKQNEWYSMPATWGFEDFSRISVYVTSQNEPIQNAVVKLLNNQESTVFSAKTDNKGMAYVFPYLFEKDTDMEYIVEVSYDGEMAMQSISNMDTTQFINVSLEASPEKSNEVDIMFMIDTTGSMSDELSYIQSELTYVIEEVQEANANDLDIRVSANFYRDQQDDYVCKTFEFDDNISKVVKQISRQSANGGGDYPEAVEVALQEGISNHEWNEDARARIMFLILDAPPHLNSNVLEIIKEQTLKAAEQGIKIIPVASSGVDKNTEFLLRFLDTATNGTYVFLTDDSGIGNSHIEPTVGMYRVEYLNDLLIRLINEEVE